MNTITKSASANVIVAVDLGKYKSGTNRWQPRSFRHVLAEPPFSEPFGGTTKDAKSTKKFRA